MARRSTAAIAVLAALLTGGQLSASGPSNDRYAVAEIIVREALESGNPDHPKWEELRELVAPGLEREEAGALYYAAFLYIYGRAGFPVDPRKADALETAAAKLRYVPAMRARALRADRGLPPFENRDAKTAAYWFRKLAEEGSASAACWLIDARERDELEFRPSESELKEWRVVSQACGSP